METLRNTILHGGLPPGTKLDQKTIAERLNVSRMPVREALRQLAAEGLVVLHPHRGAFVAALSVTEIDEIYAIRMVLERQALQLAIPRLTDADLDAAWELNEEIRRTEDDVARVGHNNDFHMTLYRPSGHWRLLGLVKEMRATVQPYFKSYFSSSPENIIFSVQEHEEILKACRDRDVARAQAALDRHILRSARRIIRQMAPASDENEVLNLMTEELNLTGIIDDGVSAPMDS